MLLLIPSKVPSEAYWADEEVNGQALVQHQEILDRLKSILRNWMDHFALFDHNSLLVDLSI